jgi:hypothetical protein
VGTPPNSRFSERNFRTSKSPQVTGVIRKVSWSGRRDLNPRRPPWQGGTLPLSYSRRRPESSTRLELSCQARCAPRGTPLATNAHMGRARLQVVAFCRPSLAGGGQFRGKALLALAEFRTKVLSVVTGGADTTFGPNTQIDGRPMRLRICFWGGQPLAGVRPACTESALKRDRWHRLISLG